jgi:hypothetical protein
VSRHVFTERGDAQGVPYRSAALESRVLVGYVTSVSLIFLVAQTLLDTKVARRVFLRLFHRSPRENMHGLVRQESYVDKHGGPTILAFQACRFLANTMLFGLATYIAFEAERQSWGLNVIAMTSVRRCFVLLFPVLM